MRARWSRLALLLAVLASCAHGWMTGWATFRMGMGIRRALTADAGPPLRMCAGESDGMKKAARKSIAKPKRAPAKERGKARVGGTGGGWDATVSLEDLRVRQAQFASERTWDQHHTPRNLALAMVGEVGELCECFQWRPDASTAVGLPGWSEEGEMRAPTALFCFRCVRRKRDDMPAASRRQTANTSVRKCPTCCCILCASPTSATSTSLRQCSRRSRKTPQSTLRTWSRAPVQSILHTRRGSRGVGPGARRHSARPFGREPIVAPFPVSRSSFRIHHLRSLFRIHHLQRPISGQS